MPHTLQRDRGVVSVRAAAAAAAAAPPSSSANALSLSLHVRAVCRGRGGVERHGMTSTLCVGRWPSPRGRSRFGALLGIFLSPCDSVGGGPLH